MHVALEILPLFGAASTYRASRWSESAFSRHRERQPTGRAGDGMGVV
jgi:hypothetical protein